MYIGVKNDYHSTIVFRVFSFCNLIRRITLVQDNDVYIVIAGLIIIITDIKNRRAEVVKLKSSLTKETNKREREFRKIATKNIASPLISHTTLNCLDLEQRRKIEQKNEIVDVGYALFVEAVHRNELMKKNIYTKQKKICQLFV